VVSSPKDFLIVFEVEGVVASFGNGNRSLAVQIIDVSGPLLVFDWFWHRVALQRREILVF
jgi:hypothetical protein